MALISPENGYANDPFPAGNGEAERNCGQLGQI
jgi:hypothetical protein